MMRKDCVTKVGGYNEGFRVSQDYDLWLRLSEHCELANLPDQLYQFRFTKGSITAENRDLQLAYQRLAKELAQQRLQGLDSVQIPKDIVAAFPPEPLRKMLYVRWFSYLAYVSGQTDQAKKSLLQAQDLTLRYQIETPISWEDWAFSMALAIASLKANTHQGAEFIIWVFTTLSLTPERENLDQYLGQFYADRAFHAFKAGEKKSVLDCAKKAISYDRTWLRNRGLWAIAGKSLIS